MPFHLPMKQMIYGKYIGVLITIFLSEMKEAILSKAACEAEVTGQVLVGAISLGE